MKRLRLLLVCLVGTLNAQTPFSLDSATVYLKTLAGEIGARPMGSPNERRAMEFAVQKFREFGLQESFIMPIDRAYSGVERAVVNTRTGIAIGRLDGTTDRIIVIGGHIDSANPDIPGANDDGSGSAVVLELARVLAKRSNESTIVFALFGGEEQGLVGSRYFVETFPEMEKVVLMLQVDMANGSDWLVPFIDTKTHSAPVWLVRAAYEEFAALGYRGLSYPTHFFTLNAALPGGGASSDHEPFLARGIPAIDFTSDINDPIHTPEDSYEHVNPAGLKRSGDLVYRLVERFDGGVPEEKTGNYFLYEIGATPLFIPLWAVKLFIVAAVLLAVVAHLLLRKRAKALQESQPTSGEQASVVQHHDAQLPGLKLFLLMLIIQTCVWLSDNVVGILKGVRFPWWSNVNAYGVLGFLGGVVGVWFALQLGARMPLSKNPARYFLRAAVFLAGFLLLALSSSTKLAFSPAFALFFVSLALLVRQPLVRIVLWFVSAHFMFHLLFSEGFGLAAHTLAMLPRSFLGSLLLHVFLILFFSLWSFPFLLGFAALWFDANVNYCWLSHFRKRRGLLIAGSSFALYAALLVFQPTFSREWKQLITVEHSLDAQTGRGTVRLKSNEYLDGTTVSRQGNDSTISGRVSEVTLGEFSTAEPWITANRSIHSDSTDSTRTIELTLHLTTRTRPYTLKISYSSAPHVLSDVHSPYAYTNTERTITLRWHSFPDTSLTIPLRFTVARAARVQETIEATFLEPLTDLRAHHERATTVYRSIIHSSQLLHPSP
jgi:hypothetical protein